MMGQPSRWWHSKWVKAGSIFLGVLGACANIIQVITAGEPSIIGLSLLGIIVLLMLFRLVYVAGGKSANGKNAMLAGELRDTQAAIDQTFGRSYPYDDNQTVVFHVGEAPDQDRVDEIHTTETVVDHGPMLSWYVFEAFSRGPAQVLNWTMMDLNVTRRPDGHNQAPSAYVIKLQGTAVPRAVIAFAPPWEKVAWNATYRSPGFWDLLRRDGQLFQWAPPRIDLGGGRWRTPITSATLIFRVPTALGRLEYTGLPQGATWQSDAANGGLTVDYRLVIADVAATLQQAGDAQRQLACHLRLMRGGVP
jgi:hypothetical protein